MTPFPHQIEGALFLDGRTTACLADEPRVGKTGAAIMAADMALAEKVLVVTTASGRPVWHRAFRDWSPSRRVAVAAQPGIDPKVDTVVVGWPALSSTTLRAELLRRNWDRIILDESHFAKNFDAKRTAATYGEPVRDGRELDTSTALIGRARGVWCLTGTPLPNSPADVYPMLRALAPERLEANYNRCGGPDVTLQSAFMHRYCIIKMKKISNFRQIPVVIGGRNLEELRRRIDGFMLRRTQADVNITQSIFETMPLVIGPRARREIEAQLDKAEILDAAERGETKDLEMHLGPLRRLTGGIKAPLIVEALEDEFACGLDKVVLMCWHRDTIAALRAGLSRVGVVGIDGSTSADERQRAVEAFSDPRGPKVFVGQIQAAGEAIDLSAASELIFVETSFVPKDMRQAALRITNLTAKRISRVRVAVLEGSIDEALQTILMRKWTAIREVLK